MLTTAAAPRGTPTGKWRQPPPPSTHPQTLGCMGRPAPAAGPASGRWLLALRLGPGPAAPLACAVRCRALLAHHRAARRAARAAARAAGAAAKRRAAGGGRRGVRWVAKGRVGGSAGW